MSAANIFSACFFVLEDCGEDGADYIETKKEMINKLKNLKKRIEKSKKELNSYSHYKCKYNSKPLDGQHFIQGLDDFGKMAYEMLWDHIRNNPELKKILRRKRSDWSRKKSIR